MNVEWLKDYILANASANGYSFPVDAFSWPAFDFNDVQQFFYTGTDQEHWTDADFPYIKPPFQTMFMEARGVNVISSEGRAIPVDASQRMDRICILVVEDRPRPEMVGASRSVAFMVFIEALGRLANVGTYHIGIDDQGAPVTIRDAAGKPFGLFTLPDSDTAKATDDARRSFLRCCVEPAMLALTFLNCKDTRVQEALPSRAIRRRHAREGLATSSYYVLDIQPLRRAVAERRAASGETLIRALHYCRGHFAIYTEENPLFGKLTGRYWRRPHLRGKVDSGVIVKDYAIGHAPPLAQ